MRIRWGTSNIGYAAAYIVYDPSDGDAFEPDNVVADAKPIAKVGFHKPQHHPGGRCGLGQVYTER